MLSPLARRGAAAALLALAATLLVPDDAGAQLSRPPGGGAQRQPIGYGRALQVQPYAGYMIFQPLMEGPLGTSISSANGAIYGAQLALRVAPQLAIVGNLGYSTGDLQVGVPFFGAQTIGTNTLLLYDGGLQLELPALNRDAAYGGLTVTPVAQAGIGAIHYRVERSFINTEATNLAWNLGLGFDVAIGRDAGIRLLARDYIGRFDFKEATGFDAEAKTAHNIALTVGLRLDF